MAIQLERESWQKELDEVAYTEDSTRVYLQQAARYPTLSPPLERFVILANVQKMDIEDLRESEAFWVLVGEDPDLQRKYQTAFAESQTIKQLLINCNLRLVVYFAKKYLGRGLSLLELISLGNVGLLEAVEKFDHKKTNKKGEPIKFSTYAKWRIEQQIRRGLLEISLLHIPVNLADAVNTVRSISTHFEQEFGRLPTDEELTNLLKKRRKKIKSAGSVKNIIKTFKRDIDHNIISLDSWVGEDSEDTFGDFVEDLNTNTEDAALDIVEKSELERQVEAVLKRLDPRQKKIIELCFKGNDGRGMTEVEAGKIENISHARIGQIKRECLEIIKENARQIAIGHGLLLTHTKNQGEPSSTQGKKTPRLIIREV